VLSRALFATACSDIADGRSNSPHQIISMSRSRWRARPAGRPRTQLHAPALDRSERRLHLDAVSARPALRITTFPPCTQAVSIPSLLRSETRSPCQQPRDVVFFLRRDAAASSSA